MPESEHKYNEYGEAIDEEVYAYVPKPHEWFRPLDAQVMHDTVINYRRSKSPNKLSDFERCSLTGEKWEPHLNKRQRENLKRE